VGKVSDMRQREVMLKAQPSVGRKGDTSLDCLGQKALRGEQRGVFTPCKNCNFGKPSRDYTTVEEAVFSLCRAAPHLASPRLLLSDNFKRLDRATVRRGHVTSALSAVMSHNRNTMTQQWTKLCFYSCLTKDS
jgi:hypothetical protein